MLWEVFEQGALSLVGSTHNVARLCRAPGRRDNYEKIAVKVRLASFVKVFDEAIGMEKLKKLVMLVSIELRGYTFYE